MLQLRRFRQAALANKTALGVYAQILAADHGSYLTTPFNMQPFTDQLTFQHATDCQVTRAYPSPDTAVTSDGDIIGGVDTAFKQTIHMHSATDLGITLEMVALGNN